MIEVYLKNKVRGVVKSLWAFLWLMTFVVYPTFGQERTVSGQVLDAETNEAIPGATILVKGTTNGTITDLDGNYTISVGEEAVLTVSFVGYKSQEVAIGNKSVVDVSLGIDVTSLDEVVVVGYGTQRKKVVTAATTQVKGDDLVKRKTTSPMQALQGQAAGVSIRSNSGQPGEGLRVNIRGLGTTGNGGPLYIVDGIATGDISYLNPADIETIDVLKDAASAAIYGSRAANGVVLITTKSGTPGQSSITFDAFYGLQNRPKDLELLSARQYAQIMNEQHLNSGGTIGSLPFDINNLPAYTSEGSANTDWLDEMFEDNAVQQNYSFGISGGNDNGVYSMSFSYTGQEGIVGGADQSNFERYNARVNSEYKFFNDKLKIGENLTFTYSNKNGIGVGGQYSNSLRSAYNVSPLMPVYNDYGQFFNSADTITDQFGDTYWNNTEANPYGSMVINNQNQRNDQKILGKVYAELELIDGLKLHTSFGADIFNDERRSYLPEYELSIYSVRTFSSVAQSMSRGRAFQFDAYADYDFRLSDNQFKILLGMSSRDYQGSYIYGTNAKLIFESFEKAWLNNATNEEFNLIDIGGAPNDQEKLLSYFTRVGYNFKEKYLFNATIRADGSSNFAEGNRWGIFPSVSAGWVLSDEVFLASVSTIDFMKVRASWGQNGNQNIPAFQFVAPVAFGQATYNFGDQEAVNTPGAYPSRLASEDVKWETSEQINVGLDLKFISGRLQTSIDWYKKSTKDWLVQVPVLATAGADAPVVNGGLIENTGLELELSYRGNVGALGYSVSANGNYNKNEVIEIPTEDETVHGSPNTLFANSPEFYQARAGYPIGYFWGFEMDGLFQNTEEVNGHTTSDGKKIQPNAKPGDVRYIDRNDDGLLNDEDKVQLGNPNPKVNLGINISLTYKGFDFSVMGYGAFGHQIVQSYRNRGDKFANYTTDVLDRWTGEGTSNSVPRVTNGNVNYVRFSSLFVQNGDFFRIGNVTLGYDFSKLMDTKVFREVRIYVAVNNLATFTKYTGMDPDIGFGFDNGIQDRFSSGIDLGFYPNPRTTMAGVSLKF